MVDSELHKAFSQYFPAVEALVLEAIPADWEALRQVLESQLAHGAHQSRMVWPLAAAVAAGGDARAAIPVSASTICAWVALQLREFAFESNLADSMLQEVGPKRMMIYAEAIARMGTDILRVSPMPWDVFQRIQAAQLQSALLMAQGQDLKCIQRYRTVKDYWRMAEATLAADYATVTLTGALAVTEDGNLVRACATVGHHVGMFAHFCNDLALLLRTHQDTPQIDQQIILPVLYGLDHAHPQREELLQIVQENRIPAASARVLEILAIIDAKAFVKHLAMQELEQAIAALQQLPANAGVSLIAAHLQQFRSIDFGFDAIVHV
jgi:hypothetical protein